jgi:hypothetical protein
MFWLAVGLFAAGLAPAQTPAASTPEVQLAFTTAAPGEGPWSRPGLLVFLIDASGSMNDPDAPKRLWPEVVADIPRQVIAYAKAGGQTGFQVRVYRFSSSAARWENPELPASHEPPILIRSEADAQAFAARFRKSAEKLPDGTTQLFKSLEYLGKGLGTHLTRHEVGWSRLIVYSDGLDSQDPRGAPGGGKILPLAKLSRSDTQRLQGYVKEVESAFAAVTAGRHHETIFAALTDGLNEGLGDLFAKFAPGLSARVVDGVGQLPRPPEIWSILPASPPNLAALSQPRTLRLRLQPPSGRDLAGLTAARFALADASPGLASVAVSSQTLGPGHFEITFAARDAATAAQAGGSARLTARLEWKEDGVRRPSEVALPLTFASVAPIPHFDSLGIAPIAVRLGERVASLARIEPALLPRLRVRWTLHAPTGQVVLTQEGAQFQHTPAAAGRHRLAVEVSSREDAQLTPSRGEVPVWVVHALPEATLAVGSVVRQGQPIGGLSLVDRGPLAAPATGLLAEWRLAVDAAPLLQVPAEGKVEDFYFPDTEPHAVAPVRLFRVEEVGGARFEFRGPPLRLQAEPVPFVRIVDAQCVAGRPLRLTAQVGGARRAKAVRITFPAAPSGSPALLEPVLLPLPPGEADTAQVSLPLDGPLARRLPRQLGESGAPLLAVAELVDAGAQPLGNTDRYEARIEPFRVRLTRPLGFGQPAAGATVYVGQETLIALPPALPSELGEEEPDRTALARAEVELFAEDAQGNRLELGAQDAPLALNAAGGFQARATFATPAQQRAKFLVGRLRLPEGESFETEALPYTEARIPLNVSKDVRILVKSNGQEVPAPHVVVWDGLPPRITAHLVGTQVTLRPDEPATAQAPGMALTVEPLLITLTPGPDFREESARVTFHHADGMRTEASLQVTTTPLRVEGAAIDAKGRRLVKVFGDVTPQLQLTLHGSRTTEPTYWLRRPEEPQPRPYAAGERIPAPTTGCQEVELIARVPVPLALAESRQQEVVLSRFAQYPARQWGKLLGLAVLLLVALLVLAVLCFNNGLLGRRYRWALDAQGDEPFGRSGRIAWKPSWHLWRKSVHLPMPLDDVDPWLNAHGAEHYVFLACGGSAGRQGIYRQGSGNVSLWPLEGHTTNGETLLYSMTPGRRPLYLMLLPRPAWISLLLVLLPVAAVVAAIGFWFSVYSGKFLC